jgi:hypothetical protein
MYLRQASWSMHNIAERLSFSSYSKSVDDQWSADRDRPYQIVLMPGYTVPEDLDRMNKDARWFEGPIEKPMPVWDGYCPYALFEVIYECFDYAGPGGRTKAERIATGRHVVVRDVAANRVVEDDRDPERMRFRPLRGAGWGLNRTINHMADLYSWSLIFRDCNNDPSATATMNLYEDIICAPEYPKSRDSARRMSLMQSLHLNSEDLLLNPQRLSFGSGSVCNVGPRPDRAGEDDADEALFDTSWSTRRKMRHLLLRDLAGLGRAPESLYRYAVALGAGDIAKRQHDVASAFKNEEVEPATEVNSDGLLDRIMSSEGGDIEV